jgi:uncharacterized paraquat-inducible protein A
MGKLKTRYLLIAVLVEVVALAVYFPAFIEGMMRHSANAPHSQTEVISGVAAFILHLPTVLVTYPFGATILVTPITQVIFLTWLLTYIGRRKRNSGGRNAGDPGQ